MCIEKLPDSKTLRTILVVCGTTDFENKFRGHQGLRSFIHHGFVLDVRRSELITTTQHLASVYYQFFIFNLKNNLHKSLYSTILNQDIALALTHCTKKRK